MPDLKPLEVREECNYVAYFITFACNLHCPYCINLHDRSARQSQLKRKQLKADEWIAAANRLILREDLPLTLQGGEPTLHKGFYRIVNEAKDTLKMDLLTNMAFDADEFVKNVPVRRFTRQAPYAPIRVSYHPGQNDIEELIRKTFVLRDAGFSVGIYGVLHPDKEIGDHILRTQERCIKMGIDFRTKEFLGAWNGRLHGLYKYEGSISGTKMGRCECRTTELIVDPSGYVYRCHADLYKGRCAVAHILDEAFSLSAIESFLPCDCFGDCNPCDVKIKTNRHQIFGHTSVEIRNVQYQ